MKIKEKIVRNIPIRRIQELVIYFVMGTFAGYYLEVIWKLLTNNINTPRQLLEQFLVPPLAEPYGFGVVAVILFVVPFIEKNKLGLVLTYLLNVLATGLTEYICAVVLVLTSGRNKFWDYSGMPLNIQGYTCLEAYLVFGAIATMFVYLSYPACERVFNSLTRRRFQILFAVSSLLYLINLIIVKR